MNFWVDKDLKLSKITVNKWCSITVSQSRHHDNIDRLNSIQSSLPVRCHRRDTTDHHWDPVCSSVSAHPVHCCFDLWPFEWCSALLQWAQWGAEAAKLQHQYRFQMLVLRFLKEREYLGWDVESLPVNHRWFSSTTQHAWAKRSVRTNGGIGCWRKAPQIADTPACCSRCCCSRTTATGLCPATARSWASSPYLEIQGEETSRVTTLPPSFLLFFSNKLPSLHRHAILSSWERCARSHVSLEAMRVELFWFRSDTHCYRCRNTWTLKPKWEVVAAWVSM